MITEERAKQFADKYTIGDSSMIGDIIHKVVEDGYLIGATDQKKIDIDKACILIKSMAGNYLGLIHEKGLCASTFHMAEFVKDFRKAMEDEK